jgi:phosphoribosylanthranilate isomerase
MSVFVKICGLRDADSVVAAAEASPDAVGFVFAGSPRRVTPEQARRATKDLPGHVQRVAVMLHPSNEDWARVLDEFTPDVLQTDIGDFAGLAVPDEIVRWPVIREGDAVDGALPEVFVYEAARSGRGETVDWSVAAGLAKRGRMILAGGLGAGNVATAIRVARPWGVDVSSAVESSPGVKDIDLIGRFIGAVRAAEKTQ